MLCGAQIVSRALCRQTVLSKKTNVSQLMNAKFSACAAVSCPATCRNQKLISASSSACRIGSKYSFGGQLGWGDLCRFYCSDEPPLRYYESLEGFDGDNDGYVQVYQYANRSVKNIIRVQKMKFGFIGFTGVSYLALLTSETDLIMKVATFYLTILTAMNFVWGRIMQRRVLRIYVKEDKNEAKFVGVDAMGRPTEDIYKLHEIKSFKTHTPAQFLLEVPPAPGKKAGKVYSLLMNMTNEAERIELKKNFNLQLQVRTD